MRDNPHLEARGLISRKRTLTTPSLPVNSYARNAICEACVKISSSSVDEQLYAALGLSSTRLLYNYARIRHLHGALKACWFRDCVRAVCRALGAVASIC